jgi:ribonuclease J
LRELFEENNYNKFEDNVYLMSTSEPFSEELEIEFRRLSNWINLVGLKYEYSHCSWHAHKEDLMRIVNDINPQKGIIPLHTTNPLAFRNIIPKETRLIVPKLGRKIQIS